MPEAQALPLPTGANGAPAKSTSRVARRAMDPTANVPLPGAEASTEAPEAVPPAADPQASVETPPPETAAAEPAQEEPANELEEPKPTESAIARSLRKREAKLEAEKAASRKSVEEAQQQAEQYKAAVVEAREFGARMQQRETQFVAAIKNDPVTVLEQLGISKRALADALMGKIKAPVDDRARTEVEALKREVMELKQGLTSNATTAAQQQAESQALAIVKTDPAYRTLAKIARAQGGEAFLVQELNEAAGKLLARGMRVPLQEIVAAVERKHASLAQVYGGSAVPAAAGQPATAANRVGHPGAQAGAETNPPTLSSRTAGERASGTLDPIKDEEAVNALAIQNADAVRRSKSPRK